MLPRRFNRAGALAPETSSSREPREIELLSTASTGRPGGRVRIELTEPTMEQTQCVFVANGDLHAHQVREFLEAAGIATAVSGESLRHTHGLTMNGLGAVRILVADADVEQARRLLESAESGQFRVADGDETNQ